MSGNSNAIFIFDFFQSASGSWLTSIFKSCKIQINQQEQADPSNRSHAAHRQDSGLLNHRRWML